jgi:hypothetical protein
MITSADDSRSVNPIRDSATNEPDGPCVLGFEGGWRAEYSVSWGSAALWDGERVVNMGSGLGRRGRQEWDECVESGVVTSFARPIPVKPGTLSTGAIVLAMTLRPDGGGFVGPGLDWFASSNSLGAWNQGEYVAVLYRNDEDYAEDVRAYVSALCTKVGEFVSTGLVLGGHGIELNALRTTLRLLQVEPGNAAFTKALGRAILRTDPDRAMFERMFGPPPGKGEP